MEDARAAGGDCCANGGVGGDSEMSGGDDRSTGLDNDDMGGSWVGEVGTLSLAWSIEGKV